MPEPGANEELPPPDQVDSVLKVINKQTKSAVEIMESLNLKHRSTFRNNYLNPALKLGLIEMTIPDKPTSQLQRYRLTKKGKTYLSRIDF